MHFLVVEGAFTIALGIAQLLRTRGMIVEKAASGEDAIEFTRLYESTSLWWA
jgi:hypothetical protein